MRTRRHSADSRFSSYEELKAAVASKPAPVPVKDTRVCNKCCEVGHIAVNCGKMVKGPCFYCKEPGHYKSECPKKSGQGNQTAARPPPQTNPRSTPEDVANPDKKKAWRKEASTAAQSITTALDDEKQNNEAILDAAADLIDEAREAEREAIEEQKKLKRELDSKAKPFERARVVLRGEGVSELLLSRPLAGCSTVSEALKLVDRAEAMDDPGLLEPLLQRIRGAPMIVGKNGWVPESRKNSPKSYTEYMYCQVLEELEPEDFIKLGIGAVVGGGLTRNRNKYIQAGATLAGLGAAYWLRRLRSHMVLLRITHHFEYQDLDALEQQRLSLDRRNISFRLARVAETTYGVRLHHYVTIEMTKDTNWNLSWTALANFARGMGTTLPALRWDPVPTSAIMIAPNTSWEPHMHLRGAAFYTAEEVRSKLRTTLPCLDGVVVDLTLFDWMTTHPRFMAADRTFEDVKAFLRLSFCANGQIANDFMSGEYTSVYPATAVFCLTKWLSRREQMAGKWNYAQEWSF